MKKTSIGILVVLILTLILAIPVLATEMKIIGKVNDNYQIETDQGDVYEVADTDMGNELLSHVGEKVEVTGTVSEEEGVKIIRVAVYIVLEE
jgi:hypothetical protein